MINNAATFAWKEYIRSGGNRCPYCGSKNLTFSNVNGNELSADIECIKCKKTWQEFFTLTGVKVDGKDFTAY
jgi:DNA-directed RNA polymerase subunit RPC12/RpoP